MKGSLVLVALILAIPASVPAQESPEFNAMCGDLACRVERVPATWQLLSVGPDLPFLKIVYESGGCLRGNGNATITETSSQIEIAVDQEKLVAIDTPDRLPVCTDELRYRRFSVLLKHPIAGRPIVGGPRIRDGGLVYERTRMVDGRVIPLVPRVGDMSSRDATALLRFQGFKVRRLGKPRGRVAFQSPLPGKPAPGNTVRLTIGFGAFHARALKRCLERAGVRTTILRPRPGNEEAPELDLWLGPPLPETWAFVAFYTDPVRATEHLPAIRRNVRRFDGEVERIGSRITVAWAKPTAARREVVRGCVAGAKP